MRRNTGGVEISGVWNQDFISHGLLTFPNGQEYAGPLFKEKGKQVASQLITWLEQPGNNTDPHIQLFLAGVYRDFVKPAPDLSVSELWLSRAAAGGLAQAQFELALAQLEQDAGSAVRNLQRAASQGHAGASQRLGEFHHVGLHVERDPQQAAAYYATAVAKGSVVATNNLAWLLATTTDTDVANPEQAIELIQPLVVYLGNWQHIDTYAAALARLGNFTRARRMQTLALEHAQTEADDATMEQMQARLALYQAKTEYQE